MKWLLIPGLLMLALSTPAADPVAVEFAFSEFQHTADGATAETSEAGTRLRVKSKTGIGHCTITPKKGTWPEQVSIVLEGLDELEHFGLSAGRMTAQGSRKTSGQFEFALLGKDRDATKASRVGTLDIKVERLKDGVAVTLPAKLLAENEAVTISWINWLRR